DGDPLSGIIRCPCGAKRYILAIRRKGMEWTYYICSRKRWRGEECKYGNVPAGPCLQELEADVLAVLGDGVIGERVPTVKNDIQREVQTLQDSRRKYEKLLVVVKNPEMENEYIAKLGEISDRLTELAAMPERKPGPSWRLTDKRLRDMWVPGDWQNN